MVFWLFRRKSNRRQSGGGVETSQGDTMQNAGSQRGHSNGGSEIASGPERRRSRKDAKRKSSRESKKLQRDPEKRRTYSFSPGRNDSLRVLQDTNRPPVPPLPSSVKGKGRADTEKPEPDSAGNRLPRARTQPPESTQDWQRVPTLHKRSAQDVGPRKSSKKRKEEEHGRETEIMAMISTMPTRAATNPTGRLIRREIRKMPDGSDVSLPSAESIHSSLSRQEPHQTSFKVSALDALAPRPTIRYSEKPRYTPSGSQSRRRRVSDRIALPEETLKAKKRIDDLADDLDAAELRELMERDQKRKEKKKIADKIKLEKKLAQRQQKQREGEATAVRNGTPPPPNMERGVFGRDVVGLGIENGTSAVVTSSKRKDSSASQSGQSKRPTDVFREDSTQSNAYPYNTFHRSPSLRTEDMTPGAERDEPVIKVAQVGTVGKANISPPSSPITRTHRRGASSISQMMDLMKADESTPASTPIKPTESLSTQQSSSPSDVRKSSEGKIRVSGWSSFFKRNPKIKRDSTTPSSFSNTSRDSMQTAPGPPTNYMPMRSNMPKRTMSKFREDLPELPLSPPDSRVQSPEADVVPPIREYPDKKIGHRSSPDDQHVRYDTPMSGLRTLEAARVREETPTSGHRSLEVPSPSPEPTATLAQSLASIDSEGSWLSGRKGGSKRGSAQIPTQLLRESASSLERRYKEHNYSDSAEELGIAEDEYFSRLTPGPEDQFKMQRRSTTVPSSDDEEGGSIKIPTSEKTKWGAVAHTPIVIHHEPRAKSREGLLNDYEAASVSDVPGETPPLIKRKSYGFNPDSIEGEGLQRATSIDLGKRHARHISAGSARLLDLKRASGEKRMSSG